MKQIDQADPLLAALVALAALTGADDRTSLAALRSRLAGQRLRVLVAGEAKRGKSTVANALLGREVLPCGVTPLTAIATTVRYGRAEGVRAEFRDGRSEDLPLSALGDLVTERANPGNRLGLTSVTATVDTPLLALGAELVDTPGTGSVYAHNTTEAEAALETMDAAVFVLTADPPVSASERELMARVAGLSASMFVVLNKTDYLAGADLAEAVEFTSAVAAEAAGRAVRVHPVSARAALTDAGDPGFTTFAAELTAYLEHGRGQDLRRSVAGHARRMTAALRDEADLARRAAGMRSGEAAARVDEFSARLAAVAQRQRDAADLAGAESRRMLAQLNAAADAAAAGQTARVLEQVEALADGALRAAPPAEIERAGRAVLAGLAVSAAESWRGEQARVLEDGLRRLDQRLTAALAAELNTVREAAAELLGLDLTVPGPGERLAVDLGFFYLTAEQAGQTELLAGAIRRRLPGETGRRRARAYLRREAAGLVPQQIGRARADLQYRLAEPPRGLGREGGARHQESTGRLAGALRTATGLRQARAGEAARQDAHLAQRQQALGQVLALLDEAAAESPAQSGSGAQAARAGSEAASR